MVLPRFRCAFVAHEAGMVSSAVYRYFPSRDELLTALILDAYWAVGERATNAGLESRGGDLMGRWLSIARAVRAWAIESPHKYALIFGTPVPGYVDPRDTVDPGGCHPAPAPRPSRRRHRTGLSGHGVGTADRDDQFRIVRPPRQHHFRLRRSFRLPDAQRRTRPRFRSGLGAAAMIVLA